MEIEHPLPVEPVLKRLEDFGHRACLAGDCVRDWLLGRIPEVWEILSSGWKKFPSTPRTGRWG